ncbi:MAG: MFS transporter [Candidatus Aenigmarchaeota archaeon]|nr:MFS transporter [Candidatus Aenigmarchaeota archaeon]
MDEQKQGMRYGVFEGVSASMMFAITNAYLTLFALALGATSLEIGMIVAIPAILSMLAYLPAAYIVESSSHRNRLAAATAFLSRGSWLLVAVVPLFAAGRLFWLLAFVCFLSLFDSFIGPSWASLMGDIVPEHRRGRYFGRRNTLCKIAALATVFIAGFVLDFFGGLTGFSIIFAAAGVFGLLTAFFFSRFPEFKYRAKERINISIDTRGAFSNRMFRRFILMMFVWQLGVSISAPFMNVFIVKEMGAAYYWVSILILVSGIAGIAGPARLGSMADRFSHRSIMIICAFGAAFIPLLYIFSTAPEHIIPVSILSGIAWAGFDLAAFNYLLETTRGKKRAIYSAFYWCFLSLAAIIGPMTGGMMIEMFASGILGLSGFGFMFLMSWIVRMLAALLLLKFLLELPDRRFYSTRYVTGELVVIGFSHVWGSFHLIKETGSIPVKIMERVSSFVRRSLNPFKREE